MKRTVYAEEQRVQMKELYLSGKAIVTIATEMNTDKGTLRREIMNMGILRTKGEAQRLCMGISYVRSNAFNILTPEALYWIGMLYADGFIENKTPVLGIALAETDKGHLEKFNQFLGGQLKVSDVTPKITDRRLKGQVTFGGKMFRVKVADRQLYDRLKQLGFTANKTYEIVPNDLLKYSRDFWRGAVDGDGWFSKSTVTVFNEALQKNKTYEYPKIGLSGNKATIEAFLKFIELSGIECQSACKKAPRENELYSMDSAGKPAIAIMNLLYKDSTVYLERKYNKYLEMISENM